MKQSCKPAKAVVTKHAAMLGAGDESIIATVEIIEFAEKIVCIRWEKSMQSIIVNTSFL